MHRENPHEENIQNPQRKVPTVIQTWAFSLRGKSATHCAIPSKLSLRRKQTKRRALIHLPAMVYPVFGEFKFKTKKKKKR